MSWDNHKCNYDNKYLKYCKEKKLPLICLPKGHCFICGDKLQNTNTQEGSLK